MFYLSVSPTKQMSPKEIIERAGLQYLGPQELPGGRVAGHMFNASTGSTLMIRGEVTPESLAEKLKQHEDQWRRAAA